VVCPDNRKRDRAASKQCSNQHFHDVFPYQNFSSKVRFYSAQYFLLSYHNFGEDEANVLSSDAKNRERAVRRVLARVRFTRLREGRPAAGQLWQ